MRKLRFAPIIRVSTESQEKKGESLRTQTTQIKDYVKKLGGVIPEGCWAYTGQEHATPNFERTLLKKLLDDAAKDKFDAVIVCDPSRWSRDNKKSKEGLATLRKYKIKFFVAGTEFNLFNPDTSFYLGLSTEVNEYLAKQQGLKSIQNRIERARRNIPTAGKLPFGRTFDKASGEWGVDVEKKKSIEFAADQYLRGESMGKIASLLGMNHPNLWKIMTKRSGTKWDVKFSYPEYNINETITLKIPELLPKATIEKIRTKAQANKTYEHGVIKNRYLLSHTIFCADCGLSFFGQTNHGNRRYYRHYRNGSKSCSTFSYGKWLKADVVEDAVLLELIELFGNPQALEKALARAIPNLDQLQKLRKNRTVLQKRLKKTKIGKDRLINAIIEGNLTGQDAEPHLHKLSDEEEHIKESLDAVNAQIDIIPSSRTLKKGAVSINAMLNARYKTPRRALRMMTYDEAKHLMANAFAGKDRQGNRLGVYVRNTGGPRGSWEYSIRAILDNLIEDELPIRKHRAEEILGIDADYEDIDPIKILDEIRYAWY